MLAILVGFVQTGGVQGSSRFDRGFLDAQALCAHLVPAGSVYAFLAEHRQRLFPDNLFEDLFASKRGRPSVPADVIAAVMVLQSLEGLSDREAVRQLETNIAWKAATGLALTDEAFHSTVLVLWRNKLRQSERPQRIFDAVRAVIVESGVLVGKHRRALDSTVLDDAVARQDTITMLVVQIRKVRRLIPELESVVVREHNLDGGRPPCDWDDPADRERLMSELVDDANELVWAAEDLALDDVQAEAVALLALVAGQDVEPGERSGTWRIARRTAEDRVISVVDPETRHSHKTQRAYRDGFKAHVAAEPDTGLVTACSIGAGNDGDTAAAADLIAGEPAGTEVLGDSAYGTGDFRADLKERGMDATIKPPPLRPAVEGGYTLDDFDIDLQANTITCPGDVTVTISKHRRASFGKACAACPFAHRCTNAKNGRVIVLHEHHALLAAARVKARTEQFNDTYRQHRPMIERTIAWLTRNGHRRLRYRGIERNQLGWSHRCAAINLQRLLALGLAHDNGWQIATPA